VHERYEGPHAERIAQGRADHGPSVLALERVKGSLGGARGSRSGG